MQLGSVPCKNCEIRRNIWITIRQLATPVIQAAIQPFLCHPFCVARCQHDKMSNTKKAGTPAKPRVFKPNATNISFIILEQRYLTHRAPDLAMKPSVITGAWSKMPGFVCTRRDSDPQKKAGRSAWYCFRRRGWQGAPSIHYSPSYVLLQSTTVSPMCVVSIDFCCFLS